MIKHILKRLLLMVPVLLAVVVLVFVVLHLSPGDPSHVILGEGAKPEEYEALRDELGLNDPIFVQLGAYLLNLVKGDLGVSYISRNPVLPEVLSRYPTTMILASFSVLWMVIIGVPVGIISATKQYSIFDKVSMGTSLIGVSMPTFWTGMLLVLWFALGLRLFPSGGWYGPIYWVLPSFSIGFHTAAIIARMTRSSILEVIRQDYVRTARAKGQSENKVILHHVLRNALLPVVTLVGIQLGFQMAGAMVTETVFSIPGLGTYLLGAIKARDYPAVMAGVICIAFTYAVINLIVDILYTFIDPRIRAQYQNVKIRRVKSNEYCSKSN